MQKTFHVLKMDISSCEVRQYLLTTLHYEKCSLIFHYFDDIHQKYSPHSVNTGSYEETKLRITRKTSRSSETRHRGFLPSAASSITLLM